MRYLHKLEFAHIDPRTGYRFLILEEENLSSSFSAYSSVDPSPGIRQRGAIESIEGVAKKNGNSLIPLRFNIKKALKQNLASNLKKSQESQENSRQISVSVISLALEDMSESNIKLRLAFLVLFGFLSASGLTDSFSQPGEKSKTEVRQPTAYDRFNELPTGER